MNDLQVFDFNSNEVRKTGEYKLNRRIDILDGLLGDLEFREWITNTALPSFTKHISADEAKDIKNIDSYLSEIYDFSDSGVNRMTLLEIYNTLGIDVAPSQKDFNKIKQYLLSVGVSWAVKNGIPLFRMPQAQKNRCLCEIK